ncbi:MULTISPECIES: hypothetical protein [Campylobacter]|jgi:hypothetical protein|uniref:hypothetical protein n=1 Tax=Campylobacter TaxID=194 RepID=UPI00027A37E1|nr:MULTISPECIES: hypothetical protein [Campylobacter]EJP75584.1 hypothetical protein HMPREF1139_0721 [Campylobacter sp. FOBRC14]QKF60800.1 hypothetical protein CCVT_0487 [Campylobacter curvus]UEB49122.1 hypothetical protein LK426_05690 [Campylobacter curvus]
MNPKIWPLFEARKILLKDLKSVDLGEFCKRRTLSACLGVDTKGFYEIVFLREAKSRLLLKEAREIDEICAKIEQKFQTAIKKRVLFYNSEICSKSLEMLKQNGWRCYDFV